MSEEYAAQQQAVVAIVVPIVIIVVVAIVLFSVLMAKRKAIRADCIARKEKSKSGKKNEMQDVSNIIAQTRDLAVDDQPVNVILTGENPAAAAEVAFVCFSCAERVTISSEKAQPNAKVFCPYCGNANLL